MLNYSIENSKIISQNYIFHKWLEYFYKMDPNWDRAPESPLFDRDLQWPVKILLQKNRLIKISCKYSVLFCGRNQHCELFTLLKKSIFVIIIQIWNWKRSFRIFLKLVALFSISRSPLSGKGKFVPKYFYFHWKICFYSVNDVSILYTPPDGKYFRDIWL